MKHCKLTLRAFTVGLLLSVANAHFSDSFWASLPLGVTVIHPISSVPPSTRLCDIPSSINSTSTNTTTGRGCREHRVLFAAATKNVGSEIDKISHFLNSLSGTTIDIATVNAQLKTLDFRSLSPSITKIQTSEENSVDKQLETNKAAVGAVTSNLQNLPNVLDRAVRISALRDALSSVTSAWSMISDNQVRGCGLYKGVLQQRIADLASFDLFFDKDADFAVLQQVVAIIVKGMVALVNMRQLCDIYGAVDPAVDVRVIYDVLIKANKIKQQSTDDLEKSKGDVSANPSSFVDGSTAFKNRMTDLLTAKGDLNDGAADVLKSDAWRMAVNGNSAVADAGTQLTASILTRHNEFSDKLTGLEGDIKTTANERLVEIGKVDGKIDEFHNKKMDQMNSMSTKFQGQHEERMGRLTGIDNKVQSITVQAKAGFTQIQGKLDSLQTNLVRVIDGVADVIKNDAALTTNELKQSLAEAFQQTQARISGIDAKIDGQAAAVQGTLSNTKMLLQNNFDQTNSVLYGASAQMSALVTSSFQVIKSTVVEVAQQTQDVVSSRVIANGQRLSEQLVEFDKKVQYVDGRLEVLADEVATLDDKLQVTNAILQDLAATAELVAVGIEDLISDIKEIFFQRTFQDLTDRYSSLRSSYTSVLANPGDSETMSSLKLSCEQAQANDLFLSFVNLVDIEDEQIPKQLEAFQSNPTKYQLFGIQVITVLDEVSMLATLCSGLLFRDDMTEEDLRRKSTENARMIRQAARQFTRQIDEVVPAYMIRQRVRDELEKASTQELGSDAAARAKNLAPIQQRLQDNIGSFAKITVIAAPRGGNIIVNHLEEQYADVDLSNIRRYGMMVSSNKAMAVVWGTTQQLPATEILDRDVLLRQGIYRGSLTASQGCTVAQDVKFYPRCTGCVCDHYEDFASTTSAQAGRVITVLNSTSIDSDFAVSAVFEAHVDYFMEQIRLDVSLDSPALAAIKAETLNKQRQRQQRVLWEGYSDNGKFHVVPGDVKGTLLATNELTLTLSPSANSGALRRVVQLFCNGKPQEVRYNTTATLTYACREIPRKSLDDGSEALVARGVPIGRLDAAVCVESNAPGSSSTKMDCRVTGAFDNISGGITAIRIGRFVRDVTVYAGQSRSGDFAVCKECQADELYTQMSSIGSIALESPDEQLLPYMAAVCEKTSDTIMKCKT